MSFEYTLLKGQITCAQKDSIRYGQKEQKDTHTKKTNHITVQPASWQFCFESRWDSWIKLMDS